ncbi:galactokinase [Halyomorpha halys]|uniref:galactokinase n=1 Tax=Halyomorpha halys TaxID=286706 RepID=UPI0006D4D3ED|nr:galactokinase-like [Halyomorpha halys]
MAEVIPNAEELLRTAINIFIDTYHRQLPTVFGWAPGRVNLVGEHTDYNEGFVFPMAIPMVTMMIGAPNYTTKIHVYTDSPSIDKSNVTFKVPDEVDLTVGEPAWANYIKGTVSYFQGAKVPGFNAVIISSIPFEVGLGTSAALVVSTYNFLEKLTGVKTKDLLAKAQICQSVEHAFAHHPCGLMDQYCAIFSRQGYALLFDCLYLNSNSVALDDPNITVLIINSNVKKNVGSMYIVKRNQCLLAAKIMKSQTLRDCGTRDLIKYRAKMEDDVYRRARHVIYEINRTIEASQALKLKDFYSLGLLMIQSHHSLRDDLEVSCNEIDDLIEVTLNAKGVYGSRITGAGFGGCTVSLVKTQDVDNIIQYIKEHYQASTLNFYIVSAFGADYTFNHSLEDIVKETYEFRR